MFVSDHHCISGSRRRSSQRFSTIARSEVSQNRRARCVHASIMLFFTGSVCPYVVCQNRCCFLISVLHVEVELLFEFSTLAFCCGNFGRLATLEAIHHESDETRKPQFNPEGAICFAMLVRKLAHTDLHIPVTCRIEVDVFRHIADGSLRHARNTIQGTKWAPNRRDRQDRGVPISLSDCACESKAPSSWHFMTVVCVAIYDVLRLGKLHSN